MHTTYKQKVVATWLWANLANLLESLATVTFLELGLQEANTLMATLAEVHVIIFLIVKLVTFGAASTVFMLQQRLASLRIFAIVFTLFFIWNMFNIFWALTYW